MADLKERYRNSPEMFAYESDAQKKEQTKPPESRLAKLMRNLRNHPDIRNLKNVQPGLLTNEKIKEQVKKVRLHMLKEIAGTREHDLTEQEFEWASQVLSLRIDLAHSPAELLRELEVDACIKDFDQACLDVRRVRKGVETNEFLADRYPSMVRTDPPSPKQYLRLERDVNQSVPEVDLSDIGEANE